MNKTIEVINMLSFEDYLHALKQRMPEFVTPRELINLGIYKSSTALFNARKSGKCPSYVNIPHRGTLFLRDAVIDFLRDSFVETKK